MHGLSLRLQSVFFFIARTCALVLRAGVVELVAKSDYETATVVVIPLIELHLLIIDLVPITSSVKQILTSQLDTQSVVEEGFDQTNVKNGLVVVQIDVLIVTWALISEIYFTCQRLVERKSIAGLNY